MKAHKPLPNTADKVYISDHALDRAYERFEWVREVCAARGAATAQGILTRMCFSAEIAGRSKDPAAVVLRATYRHPHTGSAEDVIFVLEQAPQDKCIWVVKTVMDVDMAAANTAVMLQDGAPLQQEVVE